MRSESAMCRGKVEFIEDMEEKRRALDIIMRHYTKDQFSYSDPAVRNVKVWKVPVDQMTGKSFRSAGRTKNHEMYKPHGITCKIMLFS